MADQSVTLYPGDTLTITASGGQAPESTGSGVSVSPAPASTLDPAVTAADAAVANAGSTTGSTADSPAGVVADPASIPGVGAG